MSTSVIPLTTFKGLNICGFSVFVILAAVMAFVLEYYLTV